MNSAANGKPAIKGVTGPVFDKAMTKFAESLTSLVDGVAILRAFVREGRNHQCKVRRVGKRGAGGYNHGLPDSVVEAFNAELAGLAFGEAMLMATVEDGAARFITGREESFMGGGE